ncbi:uncharacterized protein I303_100245 [Kwoniella dejecticola CBS 10117]|uniref:TauD/TfdA-like domain-containing protein n=1 Tax=Kwoniella dejecticola CBS 10117 TaxID=1296121 RepID=A0A1A6AEE0_9TREE|nr:uncharacterized protein I303_00247 [Kwoniella dejecticola CBS 10117]OBR88430.1 hypothetical protein I303_00247 [Kwoniella dejecticola CBS 10117]
MATRPPVTILSAPNRLRPSVCGYGRNAQRRWQSTSESTPSSSSSSSSRPSYSRANLASLASEGDLLTGGIAKPKLKRSSQTHHAGQAASGSARPLAFPPPKLKSNPYAPSYSVSEEELDEPLELATAAAGLSETLRHRAHETSSSRQLQTSQQHESTAYIQPIHANPVIRVDKRSDRQEDGTVIELSPYENVKLYDGYIVCKTFSTENAVITWGRLRDSCTCKICRDSSTSQRTFTTGQAMAEAYSRAGPQIEGSDFISGNKGLKITWRNHEGEKPHVTFISKAKLRRMCKTTSSEEDHYPPQIFTRKLWDSTTIKANQSSRISYESLAIRYQRANPLVMLKLLEQLQTYGLVVIEGVPTSPTDDDNCFLRKVISSIGEIRNTFYGETWDVKSMPQSKNVAYTNLDLGLHMDLLYFSSPPRIQALHCLRNRVHGGSSYFVDSFKVASDLPHDLYATLKQTSIPYIYDNDNHFLRYNHKVITDDKEQLISSPHAAINWSPPFRDGRVPDTKTTANTRISSNTSTSNVDNPGGANASQAVDTEVDAAIRAKKELEGYLAISEFEKRLSDPKYKLEFLMKEGDLVIFDNRRILHARKSFHDKTPQEIKKEGIVVVPGEPTRWLKGCYLDGEVVWDKLAVLKKKADHDKASAQRWKDKLTMRRQVDYGEDVLGRISNKLLDA